MKFYFLFPAKKCQHMYTNSQSSRHTGLPISVAELASVISTITKSPIW